MSGYLQKVFWIAIVYLLLGAVGQALASQLVAPIWPSAGVALGAILLFGYAVAPAIWLGSFLINSWYIFSLDALLVNALIALGVTMAALLGAYLVNRFANGSESIKSVKGALIFIFFGAFLTPLISASWSSALLIIAGLIPAGDFFLTWLTWWIGDGAGIITITPAMLAWGHWEERRFTAGVLEGLALLATIVLVAWLAFWVWYPIEYILLLTLVWAVFRFGIQGATVATWLILCLATLGTINGFGSFVKGSQIESLLLLETFIVVNAITAVILSAVLHERYQHALAVKRSLYETAEACQRAEAASRAKSTFLANMSHELFTPLNHMIGYSDLVNEELAELPIEDAELISSLSKDLKNITQSGKTLRELLKDILDLSHFEVGKFDLQWSEFDLVAAIDELWEKVPHWKASGNGNSFQLYVGDEVGMMYSDRAKLLRILQNILHNANKFTQQGRITLKVERKLVDQRPWYFFTITDTGIGIAQENISKIFQPFEQVDNTATRRYSGAGLGLALANLFCSLLEGDITVTSEVNKGSVFTIKLPASGFNATVPV